MISKELTAALRSKAFANGGLPKTKPLTPAQIENRKRVAASATNSLASMPQTETEYRQDVGNRFLGMMECGEKFLTPSEVDGYSFAPSSLAKIEQLKSLIIEVLANGEVNFDAAKHHRIANDFKAEIAKGDIDYLTMMSRVAASAGTDGESA